MFEKLAQAFLGFVNDEILRRMAKKGEKTVRLSSLEDTTMLAQRIERIRDGYIEQGKIEQVLNAKPKDRRALIEDAAGISGYKHKRRLAELRLEAFLNWLERCIERIKEEGGQ